MQVGELRAAGGIHRIAEVLANMPRRGTHEAHFFIAVGFLLASLYGCSYATGEGSTDRQCWLFYAALIATSLFLSWLYVMWIRFAGWAMRQRLHSSELAERLEAGLLEQDEIARCVPAPCRRRFSRPRELKPSELTEWCLKRLVNNLDWYLRPARPLFRWHWIAVPFLLVVFLMLLALDLASEPPVPLAPLAWFDAGRRALTQAFGSLAQALILYAILVLPILPQLPGFQRSVWQSELLNYLRARVDEREH